MQKKILKALGAIVLILIIVVISYGLYIKKQIDKGDLVKWNGKWYTKEQMQKLVPPQYIEVPAKNTPEEVYAKFRGALLKGDTETALSFIVENHRGEYREAFKNKERFNNWIKKLPNTIIKDDENGNFSTFHYSNANDPKDDIAHPVDFIKGGDGYWKIDQI